METELKTTMNEANPVSSLPPATGSTNINVGVQERIISAFGGAALTVIGAKNLGSRTGVGLFLSGTYLLLRGLSGYCAINTLVNRNTATIRKGSAMEVTGTFIINKPKNEVYAYWRKLENLPKFMSHLEEVKELDDKRSSWTAKVPGGLGKVSWEAEIVEDISGELLSWCSRPGSTVDNAGEVSFKDSTDNMGTEINARISYRLPAGDLGTLAAKLFNPMVEKMIREDLRSFKTLIEGGAASNISASSGSETKKSKGRKKDYSTNESLENPIYEGQA
jgi:uncharacterized membrane protein